MSLTEISFKRVGRACFSEGPLPINSGFDGLFALDIDNILDLWSAHKTHCAYPAWRLEGASDTVYMYNYDCVPCFHVVAEGGRYSRETGGFHQG